MVDRNDLSIFFSTIDSKIFPKKDSPEIGRQFVTSAGFPEFKIDVTRLRFQMEENDPSANDLLKNVETGDTRIS